MAGVKKDATTYYAGGTPGTANAMSYTAHGGAAAMRLGNGKWEHTSFNSRLQPEQIGLGTSIGDSSLLRLDYTYGTTNNNGNMQTQRIVIAGSMDVTQNYTYDELNRLKTANESSGANWSQTYGYDRFGNRWVSASPGYTLNTLTPQLQSAINAANNLLLASQYDAAGNQTLDGQTRSFEYDAENRQTKFNVTAGQYFYDGDGRRVKKVDNTGTTVFVYNAGGQLIAEYHNDPVPQPAGGGGTSYLTSDHLGSTRVVTDGQGNVKARHDYLPFGEELGAGIGQRTVALKYDAPDSTKQKFTQKERDSESGLDYFLARYYSSAQGRFTGVDSDMDPDDARDPQRWNRYAYSSNNPLARTDPDGNRWFYTQDDRGNVSEIQWVNPNADGSYTSPGAGWIEFIPTKNKPFLEVFNSDRSKLYYFGENSDASPRAGWIYAGGVSDHTMELVTEYLIFKGVGKVLGLAGGAAAKAWRIGQTVEAATAAESGSLIAKAAATVGNQSVRASSKAAAERAAREWVGEGARNIVDRQTGKIVGQISADGQKIARFTSVGKAQPYLNLVNKATGGNLHVRF